MHRSLLIPAILIAVVATAGAQTTPVRPKITGISHLALYTSNAAATERFYTVVVGAAKLPDPENSRGIKYALSATQYVEVLPLSAGVGINRMDHVAFNTDNAEAMRKYLAAKGWQTPAKVRKGADGSRWFAVLDPEGNKVEFVQSPANPNVPNVPNVIGNHIIHVGLLVHSREKEDTFYCTLLGFRPYWYGGMVEGRLDWVSQQVPDAHDWVEYMLVKDPGPGIPASMSQHQLGVLDHLSIGEISVDTAYATLKASGRLVNVVNDGRTQMGKDGKGQFNFYDPDGVRLELMNFHATEKPCCSAFTAQDPME